MRNKILLIEDDSGLAVPLKEYFEDNGLKVHHTATGGNALSLYHREIPDLILLDIILPEKNGFEVITEIRNIDPDIPIILMTGTVFNPESEIKGYQSGALNYIRKPILPPAVLALIQQILKVPKSLKQFSFENCRIRIHDQMVEINSEKYNIREKDALLLALLLNRANQIIPRVSILRQIWHDDQVKNNNLLDGAILRLRSIFRAYPSIRIKTIYGNGYMIETGSHS